MKLFIIIFFLFQPKLIINNIELPEYIYVIQSSHANRIKNYLGVDNLDLSTKIKYSNQIKQRLKELEIKCEENRQMKRIRNINNN